MMRQLPAGLREKRYGLVLLLALLVIGVYIVDDYGVSWDENAMRNIGEINLRYARSGDEVLMTGFSDKDHGAAFELPLAWIESAAGPMEYGTVIHMRHLLSFLFFLCGTWCGYLLALRLFRKQWLALLAMLMLVLQPRIFAHAFFNSKDVPFLAAILIALYAVNAAVSQKKTQLFILGGLACGYATGIRTMGALLVGLAGLVMLVDAFRPGRNRRRELLQLLLFGISTLIALYACWPALWRHPLQNLAESYGNLARYTQWSGYVLLNGTRYSGPEIPWYYAPEWFLISTPIAWILLGLIGAGFGVRRVLKCPRGLLHSPKSKTLLICAGLFVLPFVTVIALRSVLYDDWRHLYFIYPAFVMIAVYGVEKLAAFSVGRVLASVLIAGEILLTGGFMLRAHPLQQVYFNPLVPAGPEYRRKHFDYEYWGSSFRPALEYLLEHDHRGSIPVSKTFGPMPENIEALPPEKRARFRQVEKGQPSSYLLTVYRFQPEEFPYTKVWSLKAGGSTAVQIYRIDTPEQRR